MAQQGFKPSLFEVMVKGEGLGQAAAFHFGEGNAIRQRPFFVRPLQVQLQTVLEHVRGCRQKMDFWGKSDDAAAECALSRSATAESELMTSQRMCSVTSKGSATTLAQAWARLCNVSRGCNSARKNPVSARIMAVLANRTNNDRLDRRHPRAKRDYQVMFFPGPPTPPMSKRRGQVQERSRVFPPESRRATERGLQEQILFHQT